MTTHPNEYAYVYEKMMVAVDLLATGTDSLQKRLEYTWISSIMRLGPENWPEGELRDKFEFVNHKLTDAPEDPVRGTVAVATGRMNDEDAEKVAKVIFTLFLAVARLDALATPEE